MCRHGDRQASKRWRSLVAGCLLLVVSATCATIPFALQHANQGENARNLMEMPKTGAAWLTIWTLGCVAAALAGGLLLARSRTSRR